MDLIFQKQKKNTACIRNFCAECSYHRISVTFFNIYRFLSDFDFLRCSFAFCAVIFSFRVERRNFPFETRNIQFQFIQNGASFLVLKRVDNKCSANALLVSYFPFPKMFEADRRQLQLQHIELYFIDVMCFIQTTLFHFNILAAIRSTINISFPSNLKRIFRVFIFLVLWDAVLSLHTKKNLSVKRQTIECLYYECALLLQIQFIFQFRNQIAFAHTNTSTLISSLSTFSISSCLWAHRLCCVGIHLFWFFNIFNRHHRLQNIAIHSAAKRERKRDGNESY